MDARVVGEKHLKLRLRGQDANLEAIAFGLAETSLAKETCIDLVYHLKPNFWQGRARPDLHVVDWRPAQDL